MSTKVSRRDQRRHIGRVALDLFLAQGFRQTTAEQIAEAAGVSRRTFFRTFASKDDVLFAWADAMGTELAQAVERQPAGMAPFRVLKEAFGVLVAVVEADEARFRKLMALMGPEGPIPGMRASKQELWVLNLTEALAGRSQPPDVGHATLLVSIAFAALDWAILQWEAAPDERLAPRLDQAFAILGA